MCVRAHSPVCVLVDVFAACECLTRLFLPLIIYRFFLFDYSPHRKQRAHFPLISDTNIKTIKSLCGMIPRPERL